ncbi:unnamed protein product, partial [Brachionus calyciflorus]
PKKLDSIAKCECRTDLGLILTSKVNPYSCYSNLAPNYVCGCNNSQYWNSSMCVNKKIVEQSCTTNCECKEDLGLLCREYNSTALQSCYSFTGKKCLCELTYSYWDTTQQKCLPKLLHDIACDNNCQCREDLGLKCREYNTVVNSCYSASFINKKCLCEDGYYWTGSICAIKMTENILTTCSSSCNCREDLGLGCYDDTIGESCSGNVTGLKCVCEKTKFWNGSQCGMTF